MFPFDDVIMRENVFEYPSESHLRLKSREISFAHNLLLSCLIVLKFSTGHGSITAMLCAYFQNDLTAEIDVGFTRIRAIWT